MGTRSTIADRQESDEARRSARYEGPRSSLTEREAFQEYLDALGAPAGGCEHRSPSLEYGIDRAGGSSALPSPPSHLAFGQIFSWLQSIPDGEVWPALWDAEYPPLPAPQRPRSGSRWVQ